MSKGIITRISGGLLVVRPWNLFLGGGAVNRTTNGPETLVQVHILSQKNWKICIFLFRTLCGNWDLYSLQNKMLFLKTHFLFVLQSEVVYARVQLCLTFCNPMDSSHGATSLQSCLTQCDRIDGSRQVSPVPRILQAITLEWVAIAFSNA